MSPLSEGLAGELREAERDGTWQAEGFESLDTCRFEKVGFRTCRLSAPDSSWALVLSDIDVTAREPKALITLRAPGHNAAFGDLDGHVMTRGLSVYGVTPLRQLATAFAGRLEPEEEAWARRVDYLVARTIRELGRGDAGVDVSQIPPIDHPPEVLKGILSKGRAIALFGAGGAGKTTLSEGIAISLVTGLPVVPGFAPIEPVRVGLLDWDEGQEETAVRTTAIARGLDLAIPVDRLFYRFCRRPLADETDLVGRWVEDKGIEIVVISPVHSALRGTTSDPAEPVRELFEVLAELRASSILVDHVAGDDVGRVASKAYGSIFKMNRARGVFQVTVQAEELGARELLITNTKPQALQPRLAPFAVRIVYEPALPPYDTIRFEAADPKEKVTVTTDGLTSRLETWLRAHAEGGTAAAIAKDLDSTEGAVRGAISKLRQRAGLVIETLPQKGDPSIYRLGRDADHD